MGYTFYEYLILIAPDSDATLEKLKIKLEDFYKNDERKVQITLSDRTITLNIDGYNLYVGYSDAEHVQAESQEIAESSAEGKPQQSVIASCKARFEMHGDDDEDMDYFNDSLYVQEEIETFKGVFVFDSFNGEFMNV
ncbi:MAG: hypothetical protein FD123_3869 [Bacteroidetes bacterium]|nr:MAG: hypothetical protein FD123_3869 [Bacteroidota bacterium]